MIIMNEEKYTNYLLKNGFKQPYHKRFKDIFILAKYYKYIGLNEYEIQNKLFEYLNKWDKEFDINTSNRDRETIFKISYSVIKKNYTFRIFDSINITNNEFNKIQKLKGKQLKSLATIFCVLSKLYNTNNINAVYGDLMDIIKINSSVRLNILISQLEELGYIEQQQFGRFDILFLDNNKLNIEILDFISCDNCGILIKQKNNKNKYCKECSKEIKKKQDRIADKKYKNKIKSEKIENTCNKYI